MEEPPPSTYANIQQHLPTKELMSSNQNTIVDSRSSNLPWNHWPNSICRFERYSNLQWTSTNLLQVHNIRRFQTWAMNKIISQMKIASFCRILNKSNLSAASQFLKSRTNASADKYSVMGKPSFTNTIPTNIPTISSLPQHYMHIAQPSLTNTLTKYQAKNKKTKNSENNKP